MSYRQFLRFLPVVSKRLLSESTRDNITEEVGRILTTTYPNPGYAHARLAALVTHYYLAGVKEYEDLYQDEVQKSLILEHGYREKLAYMTQRYVKL
jgi:hypothetical protein